MRTDIPNQAPPGRGAGAGGVFCVGNWVNLNVGAGVTVGVLEGILVGACTLPTQSGYKAFVGATVRVTDLCGLVRQADRDRSRGRAYRKLIAEVNVGRVCPVAGGP
jgi:hypothetical protein